MSYRQGQQLLFKYYNGWDRHKHLYLYYKACKHISTRMLICCLIQIRGNNANYRCDVLNNQTHDTAKAAAVVVSQSVVGNV